MTSSKDSARWIEMLLKIGGTVVALGLVTFGFTAAFAAGSPEKEGFSGALADLKRDHEKLEGMSVKIADVIAINEAFFHRVDLAVLEPQELAEVVRVNAFGYGDESHRLALETTKRLDKEVAGAEATSALAAALRVSLAGPANADRSERAKWKQEFLRHPALVALLQGEFGDFAIGTALSSVANESDRETVLGLMAQLDATKSAAAAGSVARCWDKIAAWVPVGERRAALRQHLEDYLSAVIEQQRNKPASSSKLARLTNDLALLKGVSARQQLLGTAAPEIHFDWSSQQGLKTLSDLRGKVTVLDFWATWCGGCVEAFPQLAQLVGRYRGCEVTFLGVTSVQGAITGLHGKTSIDCRGDPGKEMDLMADYIKERRITWPVVFSREPVFNPEYGIRGLPSVVIIAPDGTVRHVSEGFSETKEIEQIDALLKEFRLRAP